MGSSFVTRAKTLTARSAVGTAARSGTRRLSCPLRTPKTAHATASSFPFRTIQTGSARFALPSHIHSRPLL